MSPSNSDSFIKKNCSCKFFLKIIYLFLNYRTLWEISESSTLKVIAHEEKCTKLWKKNNHYFKFIFLIYRILKNHLISWNTIFYNYCYLKLETTLEYEFVKIYKSICKQVNFFSHMSIICIYSYSVVN